MLSKPATEDHKDDHNVVARMRTMVRMVMVMVMVRMVERMRTMVRMKHGKVSLIQS